MSKSVPRDPSYGKPPNWSKLYGKHFPERTDPYSRHVKVIAETLRDTKSLPRKLLADAGYEPDHWASSLEKTVVMLWELREKAERAK
mgnify:FL=1